MHPGIHHHVMAQLETVRLATDRPLLICDADEVLFAFLQGLERFLQDNSMELRLESFALTGNIRHRASGIALEPQEVRDVIHRFFEERTEALLPVEGAAAALGILSERMQIVVLSNVPLEQREARQNALRRHGMDYPLIANTGKKGWAVAHLADPLAAPVVFVDDIPHNIASVAEEASQVIRLHFIADPRLAALIGQAEQAHARYDTWPEARHFIEDQLTRQGF
jgi:hypothetical protein